MKSAFLCAVVLATSLLRAPVPENGRCPGDHGEPDRVVSGTFGAEMEGAYVMVPFEVGEATRVRVKYCHDQPEAPTNSQIKHTLDLGVYGPSSDGVHDENEFIGWGGSSRPNVLITPEAHSTTVGFEPTWIEVQPGRERPPREPPGREPPGREPPRGPPGRGHPRSEIRVPPGMWAAELGLAAIAAQSEGDVTGEVAWILELYTDEITEPDTDGPWSPTPYNEVPANTESRWYMGDFHVHAINSNPNDAPMREVFDYAFSERHFEGSGADLDFITLSDYVGTRQWDEIGDYQDDYPGKLIIRSAEVITYRGHINNHASATYVDHRTGPIYELKADGSLGPVREARGAQPILDAIHAGGGWTQINHPTTFPSKVPLFDNLCRGCSYEYSDVETNWDKVDAMEVQTGPAGSPGNEIGPNPFTPLAIEWWDRLQRSGYDITAVGASDSHNAGRTPGGITQSPIGEATTAVFAEELSERGIHRAILAGHSYVKFFSARGPDLRFTARAATGPEVMMGDELRASQATFTAKVLGAALNQPWTLHVLLDGAPLLAVPVTSDPFTFEFPAAASGDYRLQLQRGPTIEALSNPINLIAPSASRVAF